MALICFAIAVAGAVTAFKLNLPVGLILVAAGCVGLFFALLPDFYAMKGGSEFQKNNFREAVKYYKKAVDTNRAKPAISAMYVNALLRSGQPEAALVQAERVLSINLTETQRYAVRQTRCLINSKLGRFEEALQEAENLFYQENLRIGNTYALIGYFRLEANRDLEETISFCEEAYEYDEENRDILDNLVCCYYRAGRYDEARELAERVMVLAPHFLEGYFHAAQIAYKQNRIEDAMDYLESIEDCKRTYLTTVSQEEIDQLRTELGI